MAAHNDNKPSLATPVASPVVPPVEVNRGITIDGAGSSSLTFRAIPSILGCPPRLNISVGDDGSASGRMLAEMSISVKQATEFVTAMGSGATASVSDRYFKLEYEITKKGHIFTVSRHGRQRALRVFTVGWSPGVHQIARDLKAKMGVEIAR